MKYLLIAAILFLGNEFVQPKNINIDCSAPPADGSFEIDKCCQFPQIFDTKILDGCSKKYTNGNDPCLALCLFNKTSLMSGGTVNQTAVTTFVKNAMSKNAVWTGLADDLLKTSCNELTAYQKNPQPGPSDCKADAGIFMSSFYFHMITKCPDSAFNKGE